MSRNSLPPGSSVFKRLIDGSLSLEDIGLSEMPEPGQVLDETLLDFSTKLESTDRYLSPPEAMTAGDLSGGELEDIKRLTLMANRLISEEAGRLGLFNEDGKVEFAFDGDRKLILVDALGTLDECRFTFQGFPVSKEIARIYYRGTSWHEDAEKAKLQDSVNWKSLVGRSPTPLPVKLRDSISHLYKAFANEITGRRFFDTPSLQESLRSITDILGNKFPKCLKRA